MNRHTVKTLTLELGTDSQSKALEIQERTKAALDGISSVFERVFDKVSPPGSLHRIEKLELELEKLDMGNPVELEKRLEESLTRVLEQKIQRGAMEVQELDKDGSGELPSHDEDRESREESEKNSIREKEQLEGDGNHPDQDKSESPNSEESEDELTPIERSKREILMFFLKHGTLPWQAQGRDKPAPEKILQEILVEYPDEVAGLLLEVLVKPRWTKRLILQFNDSQLMALADTIFPGTNGIARMVYESLYRNKPEFIYLAKLNPHQLRYFFWKILLLVFLESRTPEKRQMRFRELGFSAVTNVSIEPGPGAKGAADAENLSPITEAAALEQLKLIFAEPGFLKSAPESKDKQKARERELTQVKDQKEEQNPEQQEDQQEAPHVPGEDEEDFSAAPEIFINNAGLVLFWPFFPRFFESLQLTQENEFITDESHEQAAWMLGYLTRREEEIPESEMPLNKILCGLTPEALLPLSFEVEEKAVEECEELIGVLRNALPRLKKFKNQDILTNYINRAGSLSVRDKCWLLRVEDDGRDVLLAGLPWSVNVIKTPWMKHPLFVEWLDG